MATPIILSKEHKPWKKSHFFRGVGVKKAELLKLEDAFICGIKSDSERLLKSRKETLEGFLAKSPADLEVRELIAALAEAIRKLKAKNKRNRASRKQHAEPESHKHDGMPDLGLKPKPVNNSTGYAHLVQGGSPGLGKRS